MAVEQPGPGRLELGQQFFVVHSRNRTPRNGRPPVRPRPHGRAAYRAPDAGPSRRRHLRAVPPPLRRALAPRRRRHRGRRGARRHGLAPHDARAGGDPRRASPPTRSSSRSATTLWPGYKTGAGVPPELLAQFPLLEDALVALGVAVWPMLELEADDAMASAAAVARADPRVERVLICTPDKDLAQCVEDPVVVQLDRRREGTVIDEAGVRAKFGVESRLDPRLPRAGRRLGRRLPRPARLGREVRGHGAHPVRAPRRDPRRRPRRGTSRCAARPSSRRRWPPHATPPRCSSTSRRCARTATWASSTTGSGAAPSPSSRQWAERLGAETLVGRASRLAEKRR